MLKVSVKVVKKAKLDEEDYANASTFRENFIAGMTDARHYLADLEIFLGSADEYAAAEEVGKLYSVFMTATMNAKKRLEALF